MGRLIGLDLVLYGTHNLQRTNVALIYERTGDPHAYLLLSGNSELESAIRCLGIEVDHALLLSEQTGL